MARYPLNLPALLKQEAEEFAVRQGVSLNQFILWALSEKVGGLKQLLDDPTFPQVTYRRSGTGAPVAVVRGSGIRVATLAIAHEVWGWDARRIAAEYGITEGEANGALAFHMAHRAEIDATIAANEQAGAPSAPPDAVV